MAALHVKVVEEVGELDNTVRVRAVVVVEVRYGE